MTAEIEQDLNLRIRTLISLWRTSKNTDTLSAQEVKTAGNALLSLQRGLTGDRQLAGTGYMDNDALLGAYLLYYWPVSYMQTSFAASCAPPAFQASGQETIRILDIGSGPGPASAALADYLPHVLPGIKGIEFTLVDSSRSALELAVKILRSGTVCGTPAQVHTHSVNLERPDWIECCTGTYDIILMSHALNELWKDDKDKLSKRHAFLENAAKQLSPSGMLFVVEPALLETSRSLLAVRDMLCSQGFSISAPCTGSLPCSHACPALTAGPSHTCHAEIPWHPVEPVASLAKTAGLDRDSVKMSFFIAQKINPEMTARKDTDSCNTKNDVITARVVSEGMLNKAGRIRFLLCNGQSRFAFSAKNGDAAAKSAGFFNLRRYDLIEVSQPELRGTKESPAYGFTAETKLRLISRIS
jgi:SAM-dependent methyltransferase